MTDLITELCKRENLPLYLPELLGVYLALYDTLSDDDEDVRDQGAKTVALLLSAIESRSRSDGAISLSLSPPAARRRLIRFLKHEYQTSTVFWLEAMQRLAGAKASDSPNSHDYRKQQRTNDNELDFKLCPVADLSLVARTTQVTVFIEEKQNLYIDTVREADEWAIILAQIPIDAWNLKSTSFFESWTIEGLGYIIETYGHHIDGALSPTSKPEVYALFMRVLFSARVSMVRSAPASERGKAKENVCRKLLRKLLELGKQRLLHDLLLEHIEWILDDTPHPSQSS